MRFQPKIHGVYLMTRSLMLGIHDRTLTKRLDIELVKRLNFQQCFKNDVLRVITILPRSNSNPSNQKKPRYTVLRCSSEFQRGHANLFLTPFRAND